MSSLAGFVVRRMAAMVAVIWLAVSFVFLLSHVTGDPVSARLGDRSADVRMRAVLRHSWGLDRPLWRQYGDYVGGLLRGDLGVSQTSQLPVSDMIRERLPVSVKLAGLALALALLVGLPIGLAAALRPSSLFDYASQSTVMVLYALPAFLVAPITQILLGVRLHWLPVTGWGDPGWLGVQEMVLPVTIFGLGMAGYFAKSFRSFMLEVLRQEYIRTARAKGLGRRRIVVRHAGKNALLPLASTVGPAITNLIVGAFIIEFYFGIPGIGLMVVTAAQTSDYPVIQTMTGILAAVVVAVNALTDIFYAAVDPRVGLQG